MPARPLDTVEITAARLGILEQFTTALDTRLAGHQYQQLLARILPLPVRPSHALRSLGAYITRNGQPVCIRLQFKQSPAQLRETLLHELAHACDHLLNQPGQRYRRAHGPGWQSWALAMGINPQRTGHSPELDRLHQQRLKLVAVCQRCGAEIRRLRRLPDRRKFIHPGCGGRILPTR
jgi:predicted SprT family Zn-dependent metalloprotease